MNIKELRIGNWVSFPMCGDFQIESGRDIDEENTPNPIELTEEWLNRFGFEYYVVDDYDMWGKFGVEFMYMWFGENDDMNGYYLNIYNKIFGDYQHIKFVHTLQNVIFALSGLELTINKNQ